MASTIAAVTTSGGGVVTTADASGNLNLLAGTTTVVALTNAGAAVTGTLSVTGIATLSANVLQGAGSNIGSVALAVTGNSNNGAIDVISNSAGYILRQLRSDGSNQVGIYTPDAFGTMALYAGSTERMRIDSSGNVGIGTSSPSQKLEVYAAANSLQIESVVHNDQAGSGVAAIGFNVSSGAAAETTSTKAGIGLVRSSAYGVGSLCFYNNGTSSAGDFTTADERMRIDSSGYIFVNQTAQAGNTIQRMGLTFASNVEWGLNITSSSTATGNAVNFTNSSGTQIGQIQTSTTATAYVTSSDYRLKEDIAPMTGALAKIAALRPVTYKWKSTGETTQGFIAHELQEVIPECATGTKDGTHEEEYEVTPAVPAVLDADGKETIPAVEAVKGTRTVPSYQGIDTSFLVATLTAAIQEQQALILALTDRIAALEAK